MTDKETPVIRYTKEAMIALLDSPLVQTPSFLNWFGDDPESASYKSILNDYAVTRTSSEKNIVLGPTKTNFASSLYGGLKNQNDHYHNNSTKTQPMSNSRYNHNNHHHHHKHNRQMDDRLNTTSVREYRSPRGPSYTNDRGFVHNRQDNKSTDNRKFMNSPPHNKRNDYERINHNGKHVTHNYRNNRHQHHDSEISERVPEWMDYTPENERTEEPEPKEQEEASQLTNDLEAWKSNMKKKENDHSVVPKTEEAIEKPLASLSLEPSQDPLLFFDEPTEPRREQKGGSRFAKFFAKREEPAHQEDIQPMSSSSSLTPANDSTSNHAAQPRSISLNDLFQKPSHATPDMSTSATTPVIAEQRESIPQERHNGRVYSEEDILKSLGAKKEASAPTEITNEEGGAMGFSRVLQILSQPKPSLSSSTTTLSTQLPSSPEDQLRRQLQQQQQQQLQQQQSQLQLQLQHQQQQSQLQLHEHQQHQTQHQPPLSSQPLLSQQQPQQQRSAHASPRIMNNSSIQNEGNSHSHTGSPLMTGSPSVNHDSKIANRFGNNNLPTSVLRQMSARSSNHEGKSPLLQSTKSTPPIKQQPLQQPVLTHRHPPPPPPPHPHMPPLPMPPQQFFALQQNGPYSPGHPMMDHRAFEQLMQFNNDPRMPPPHLRNGANGEFLPPHMMMGPPPPLPPGQRPIMTPPQFNQQLPLHMQRFPLQQQQQQQQQQQSQQQPQQQQQSQQQMASMLPHLLANGIPPQLANKGQGWEQRP